MLSIKYLKKITILSKMEHCCGTIIYLSESQADYCKGCGNVKKPKNMIMNAALQNAARRWIAMLKRDRQSLSL